MGKGGEKMLLFGFGIRILLMIPCEVWLLHSIYFLTDVTV